MPTRRLTKRFCDTATSTGSGWSTYWDTAPRGLGLRVRESGRKTWALIDDELLRLQVLGDDATAAERAFTVQVAELVKQEDDNLTAKIDDIGLPSVHTLEGLKIRYDIVRHKLEKLNNYGSHILRSPAESYKWETAYGLVQDDHATALLGILPRVAVGFTPESAYGETLRSIMHSSLEGMEIQLQGPCYGDLFRSEVVRITRHQKAQERKGEMENLFFPDREALIRSFTDSIPQESLDDHRQFAAWYAASAHPTDHEAGEKEFRNVFYLNCSRHLAGSLEDLRPSQNP